MRDPPDLTKSISVAFLPAPWISKNHAEIRESEPNHRRPSTRILSQRNLRKENHAKGVTLTLTRRKPGLASSGDLLHGKAVTRGDEDHDVQLR